MKAVAKRLLMTVYVRCILKKAEQRRPEQECDKNEHDRKDTVDTETVHVMWTRMLG